MSDLFKNILGDNETLFKDPLVLDYEFVPEEVKGREEEKQFIALSIKPLFYGKSGKNLFIYGLPGIGKTVSCRHVLKELNEETDDIKTIYVNCWKKNSAHKVILEICNQINYKFTMNRTTEELIDKISQVLNKSSSVIIFDEIDKLKKEIDFLYNLLEDLQRKTIILITNEKEFLQEIDTRIKSRLNLDELEFKPYNLEQISQILKQRAEYAFQKNVFSEDALELIAEKTFELKDLRTGIYLLKESGDQAELKASRKIEEIHVEKAIEKVNKLNVRTDKAKESSLLSLIKINNGKPARDLFKLYSKDVSFKTFMRELNDLAQSSLVELKEINEAEGKKTIVNIKEFKTINEF